MEFESAMSLKSHALSAYTSSRQRRKRSAHATKRGRIFYYEIEFRLRPRCAGVSFLRRL
jgi:hypothetical protein